jgi:hypothetical protein
VTFELASHSPAPSNSSSAAASKAFGVRNRVTEILNFKQAMVVFMTNLHIDW